MIEFSLSFQGNDADRHELDFYDATQALTGFQRSLALTTHLVVNGKIITKAPFLRRAEIKVRPPEAGSWKVNAVIVGGILTGAYHLGTAPRDTPLGNLVSSAYDYLIRETLGFHVDYNSTLGQQREELQHYREQSFTVPTESQMDSLAEKCETAIKQMHRPIIGKKTAQSAEVIYGMNGVEKRTQTLTQETYKYIHTMTEVDTPIEDIGRVSSYNMNTFKGRIYSLAEKRPISFELGESVRSRINVDIVTNSLQINAHDRFAQNGYIIFTAVRFENRAGVLKKLLIIDVRLATYEEIEARHEL